MTVYRKSLLCYDFSKIRINDGYGVIHDILDAFERKERTGVVLPRHTVQGIKVVIESCI